MDISITSYMHTCNRRQRKMGNKRVIRQISNYIAVVLGTFLLAFGSVIFLEKSNLVAGGVSGIAIIVQHAIRLGLGDMTIRVYDYIVYGLMVIFWVLGLIFLGKDFALKTLLSSVLYIGFTALFFRVQFFDQLADKFAGLDLDENARAGNLILCGVFGGVFVGGGVALTFVGGGSTGGVDVLQILMAKYWRIKESVGGFLLDAVVIVVGMGVMQMWIPALCGILSSFVVSVLIEIVYIKGQTAYQVDIISDKWEEISKYAQDELERGATIIHAEGGYKGEERVILRVVFDQRQYEKIREYIASVDPKAFVTFTQTNAVFGEGFKNNRKIKKNNKK